MHRSRRRLTSVALVLAAAAVVARPAVASTMWITSWDLDFRPSSVSVAAGDQVTFVNDDAVAHQAVGSGWSTPVLSTGERAIVSFETPGTYTFRCSMHPRMLGSVVVSAVAGAIGDRTSGDPATEAVAARSRASEVPVEDAIAWLVVAVGLATFGTTLRRNARPG